jgi:hypothetical protein
VELVEASGTTALAGKRRKKKGIQREVLKKRRGMNAPLYLAELRTGRWARSDAMPDAAGGELVTASLNRMA